MTRTTAKYVQPAVGETVTVAVQSTVDLALGLTVYIPWGGYYECGKITSQTSVTLTNLGYAGNSFAGSEVGPGSRVVAAGIQGPTLGMRWTWITGAVDPAVMGGGIGTNNDKFNLASRLYIRGGSNGGGPNPVVLWPSFFARGGHIELSVPNTDKWIVYRVVGYETLPRPQVQAFSVEWMDSQAVFQQGDEVFMQYGMAG